VIVNVNVVKIVINVMKKIKNPRFKGKKKSASSFSAGGMLIGPAHEQGGISAIVDGTEPIEVEGGEFIINKQTVDAVGEEFLHRLNSTQTIHHPSSQGFNEGELPSPSQYKHGGRVIKKHHRYKSGGRVKPITTHRIMAKGGSVSSCPPGTHWMPPKGGKAGYCMQGDYHGQLDGKYKTGGITGGTNKQCSMHTSALDCKRTKGCVWNYSTDMCR